MLRHATSEDIPRLLELEEFFSSNRLSKRALKKFLASDVAELFVKEHDGNVVGYALLVRNRRSGQLHFDSLVVDSAFRSKGIGSAILEEIIARHGHEDIALDVACSNTAAIHVYEKHGFAVRKTMKEHYDDKSDAYRMVRTRSSE